MRIEAAFIAHAAEVHDDLVFAISAFPEWWWVNELPSQQTMVLMIIGEITPDEYGEDLTLDFRVQDQIVGRTSFKAEPADFVAGAPLYVKHRVILQIGIAEVGPFKIGLEHDGELLHEVRMGIRVQPVA